MAENSAYVKSSVDERGTVRPVPTMADLHQWRRDVKQGDAYAITSESRLVRLIDAILDGSFETTDA